MKRRSARPFTVEVKHARNAPAAPGPRPGGGPSRDLWADSRRALLDAQDEARAPTARPAPPARPARAEAPPRRILPNLAPAFAEPDLPAEPAAPRVRRPRAAAHAPAEALDRTSPAAGIPAAAPVPGRAAPEGAAAGGGPAPGIAKPPPAPRIPRRAADGAGRVRPGERWKRRLPRALR